MGGDDVAALHLHRVAPSVAPTLGAAGGGFHVVSVAIASLVYIQLNTFNHVKFELPGYKVLNWISFKHHVHHIDMQKGNYATITLLYDKLFGTLD